MGLVSIQLFLCTQYHTFSTFPGQFTLVESQYMVPPSRRVGKISKGTLHRFASITGIRIGMWTMCIGDMAGQVSQSREKCLTNGTYVNFWQVSVFFSNPVLLGNAYGTFFTPCIALYKITMEFCDMSSPC